MLNPWQIWKDVSDAFADEYYVVIPELDTHTQTEIRCFEGYAHAQLLSFETSKWIKEVKDFLGRK